MGVKRNWTKRREYQLSAYKAAPKKDFEIFEVCFGDGSKFRGAKPKIIARVQGAR